MNKLLVLGASIAQIPFVKTAKTLDCHVAIVDYNPKAAAIEYADEYYECSLLDLQELRKVVQQFKPDGITCGASDVGVENCAILCEEFGLPGLSPEVAHRVKDKETMIKAFQAHGVAHPKFSVICNPNAEIRMDFPLITKPVDKSGSRGINLAHNTDELKEALKDSFDNSDAKRVIVEEYMEGPEVSVEVLVQNGEPFIIQVTDKMTTGAPHFIEIGHSQPSQLPNNDVEAIKKLAYDATKAVGVVDGCCHAEIKLTNKGPKMVEIAGRLGGDFITTVLVPITIGVNMAEYEILRAIGRQKKYKPGKQINRGAAVRFIEAKAGEVSSIAVNYSADEMVGIEMLSVLCRVNKTYGSAANNNDRFGYVIATGKSALIASKRCEKALSSIIISMK